jgi:capsular polysaccharide biosynthesis protein
MSRILPEIYPKPIAFYQHPAFEGESCTRLSPDTDLSRIRLFDADEAFTARILSQLRLTKFRHQGRLRGEYRLQNKCLLALDRHGAPIKLNTDGQDDWAMTTLYSEIELHCAQSQFRLHRDSLLRDWASAPVFTDAVVLGGTHADHNYYHFSICLLPQIRHFENRAETCIALPSTCLERRFQLDLVRMTFGHRMVLPLPDGARVVDPQLIYEPVRAEGVRWLRELTGLRAGRGNRLIHIARRSSQTGRVGGCIEETPEFAAFLRNHGFETVDFGEGGLLIAQQVAMLEGARVILSAHGANLTNLAYVAEGVSVVEVMPYYWTYFSHMQVAAAVGLNHFGVVVHEVNDRQNMVARVAALEEALGAALAATPAI